MTDAVIGATGPAAGPKPKLDNKPNRLGPLGFLAGGLVYAAMSVMHDTASVGEPLVLGVFALLALALLTALGFEFVNGFHDAANAVRHGLIAPVRPR